MSGPRRAAGRGLTTCALALAAAASGTASCVRIDTAPGGVTSARLVPAPPSVALGDSLRDSTGAATPLRAVAYGPSGETLPTPDFRFTYAPTARDTTNPGVLDTALVVDSLGGFVRAAAKWQAQTGRVVIRVSNRIQLADTVAIVPRPDSLVAGDTVTLRYLRFDCSDNRPALVQQTNADSSRLTLVNTVGPFALTVRGDSAGQRVGVRRWLVRWRVDSVPAPVPDVTLTSATTGATATVPAIAVISGGADALVGYDTTSATGVSSVRLRIRPTALGPRYRADTTIRVVLRADVIAGPGVAVRGSPARGKFVAVLLRTSQPLVPANCPQ